MNNLNIFNRAKILRILLPALTFILGILISETISKLLDPYFLNSSFNFWILLSFTFILFFIAIICFLVLAIYQEIESISHRSGIAIKYLKRTPENPGILFRKMAEIIESADSTVSILTYIPKLPLAKSLSEEKALTAKEKYYSALLSKVQSKGIKYKRIIQSDDMNSVNSLMEKFVSNADEVALKHFHEILNLKETKNILSNKILFLKTKTTRTASFMIVDSRYLIWEITEVLHAETMSRRVHGAFFIDDPRGEIIQHFESFLEDIEYFSAIRREDLPPIAQEQ